MKQTTSLVACMVVLLLASCQKSATGDIIASANPTDSLVQATAGAKLSSWTSVNLVAGTAKENSKSYSVTIEDAAITADILGNGLVLVYDKKDASVQLLPYVQKGNISWYYDIAEGAITITADAAAQNAVDAAREFSYVVISGEQLGSLEGKGFSRAALVNLDYQAAVNLFK